MADEIKGASVAFTGPPIAEQTHEIFSAYASGSRVTAIILTAKGIDVGFADGSRYLFAAIPNGHRLIAQPNGQLDVVPGAFGS